MKSIKCFKYINTNTFNEFVISYGYNLADVVGFSVIDKQQYHGNILITYAIYFSDHDNVYFKVVCFKDFNEYRQSRLGFNGDKLLNWYQDANAGMYKQNNRYVNVK